MTYARIASISSFDKEPKDIGIRLTGSYESGQLRASANGLRLCRRPPPYLAAINGSYRGQSPESDQTAPHPSSVMSRAELRSQNRPGSFALLAKISCRSAIDPKGDVPDCPPSLPDIFRFRRSGGGAAQVLAPRGPSEPSDQNFAMIFRHVVAKLGACVSDGGSHFIGTGRFGPVPLPRGHVPARTDDRSRRTASAVLRIRRQWNDQSVR